jgi:hypothetical protein
MLLNPTNIRIVKRKPMNTNLKYIHSELMHQGLPTNFQERLQLPTPSPLHLLSSTHMPETFNCQLKVNRFHIHTLRSPTSISMLAAYRYIVQVHLCYIVVFCVVFHNILHYVNYQSSQRAIRFMQQSQKMDTSLYCTTTVAPVYYSILHEGWSAYLCSQIVAQSKNSTQYDGQVDASFRLTDDIGEFTTSEHET